MHCPVCSNKLEPILKDTIYHHDYKPECPFSTDEYDKSTWERISEACRISHVNGYDDGFTEGQQK